MSTTAFIRIDKVEGQSTDEKHPKWIEVLGINLGACNGARMADSSSRQNTTNPTQLYPLTFSKEMDISSVSLFNHCTSATKLDKINIDLCTIVNGVPHPYASFELEQCVVSDVCIDIYKDADHPHEKISITYAKATWTYDDLDAKGKSTGKKQVHGFDLTTNKPC